MDNSKKLIEKLAGIVAKQQKIITKLAQAQGLGDATYQNGASASWEDASPAVSQALQQATTAVGAKAKYEVQSAEFAKDSGLLRVKIEYPMAQLGGQESRAVSDKTKELLTGQPLQGGQVSKVEIIGVAV